MTLRIFSTLAVQGMLPEFARRFEAESDVACEIVFAPTMGLMQRIDAGEAVDVAVLTREGVDDLVRRGLVAVGSARDVALSLVGLAVRVGAAQPDISTPEALRAALLAAKSIAYSRTGASGIFFAEVIERLGIATAVNAKSTVIPAGFTAELAARGDAEVAIQQVSELMQVAGVDVVGPLPLELQTPGVFTAGVFARSAQPVPATRFVTQLCGAAAALEAAGLQQIR